MVQLPLDARAVDGVHSTPMGHLCRRQGIRVVPRLCLRSGATAFFQGAAGHGLPGHDFLLAEDAD